MSETDMELDEPYENTMSIEQLRQEVRRCWNLEGAMIKALRDLPEVPPYDVLIHLSSAARWPEDNNVGKRMQHELRKPNEPSPIPYKSECESGVGLWSLIRAGIIAGRRP